MHISVKICSSYFSVVLFVHMRHEFPSQLQSNIDICAVNN